jgi:HTH-type transcriptional regulator/antitoxin MqsA
MWGQGAMATEVMPRLNRTGELCPACGEDKLESQVCWNSVSWSGVVSFVPCHYSICDNCGSELAGAVESKANKRYVRNFRKRVEAEQIRGVAG